MRRFKQGDQRSHQFGGAGVGAEILVRQIGKTKLGLGRELPSQSQVDAFAQRLRLRQQYRRGGLVKLQQQIGRFDFDAFSAVQLHLA